MSKAKKVPDLRSSVKTLHRVRDTKFASYTPAVVTPPSTTIVCPVMKLEASEPR
jgi:hypothetical protein